MQHLNKRAVWLFFFSSVTSWFFFALFWLIWFGFFMVGALGSALLTLGSSAIATIFIVIVPPLLGVIILIYIWARFSWHYYKYELTENSLRKEHGIIWKKYVSIPYDRIQNVDIHRGLIARLLNLSDLQIQTAGGITRSSYGAFAEGRLPGLTPEIAEQIRNDLINKVSSSKGQGL